MEDEEDGSKSNWNLDEVKLQHAPSTCTSSDSNSDHFAGEVSTVLIVAVTVSDFGLLAVDWSERPAVALCSRCT